jgi:hypothetical protein
MLDMLLLAAEYAAPDKDTTRTYALGAIGIRRDNRIVHARNSSVLDSVHYEKGSPYRRFPESHAEARLTKRLGYCSPLVYVARVKRSGGLGLAAPCSGCQAILRAHRVERVIYTIDDNNYGIWDVSDSTRKLVILP